MTYEELDELVLGLTSGEGWDAFKQVLDAEAAASLQNELDHETIEDIKWQRGYRAGLAFAYNMRDYTKMLKEQGNET